MRATPLGIRLFARPPVIVSGAWTPASLTGLNFWLEADPTKLFTDAGTTHVASDGDLVFQANDKSSAANNVSQSGSSTQRPAYKTDLAKPSLLFSGAQFLESVNGLSLVDGSGQHWFAISAQVTTASGDQEMATVFDSVGGHYLGDLYIGSQAHMEIFNVGGSFEEDATAASTITGGTPFVAIGTAITGAVEAWVNNVSNGSTALGGTLRTGTANIYVGGHGLTDNVTGRIFGIIHGSGTLSSTDRSNIQTYMAGLHP